VPSSPFSATVHREDGSDHVDGIVRSCSSTFDDIVHASGIRELGKDAPLGEVAARLNKLGEEAAGADARTLALVREEAIRSVRGADAEAPARLVDNELSTPKGKDERPVPMATVLREVLAEAVQGKAPTDFIVVDQGRTPTRQKLYKAFVALQKRLGVSPTWSFHSLRHAFGTHAVRAGANIEAVRELMGHDDLETTACVPQELRIDHGGGEGPADGKP
jgi:integrase